MTNFTAGKFRYTTTVNQESTPSAGIAIFHAGLNILLSITATLGNILILVALQRVSSVHPPTKLLFRCLAVSDLLVGLILHPLHVIPLVQYLTKINWKIVDYVRYITLFLSFVLCGVSIFVSTAISVDRLLALLLGLRYRHVVTIRRVRAAIFGFLLVGVSIGLVYIFWTYLMSLFIALGILLLSVVISVFSYMKIFFRLRQHQAQLQGHVHQGQPNGGGIPLNMARYKKTVSSIVWVQLALVACYAPFGICVVIKRINGLAGTYGDMVWFFAVTLVYLNSSLNPFLYCWKLKEVREAVKETVRHFWC